MTLFLIWFIPLVICIFFATYLILDQPKSFTHIGVIISYVCAMIPGVNIIFAIFFIVAWMIVTDVGNTTIEWLAMPLGKRDG